MSAEIVIAGSETLERFPLAVEYRCTFVRPISPVVARGSQTRVRSPGRCSPRDRGPAADRLGRREFVPACSRAALLGALPVQSRAHRGESVTRATSRSPPQPACSAWQRKRSRSFGRSRTAESPTATAELHNFVVCPAPLGFVPIDFEGAFTKESMSEEDGRTVQKSISCRCCVTPCCSNAAWASRADRSPTSPTNAWTSSSRNQIAFAAKFSGVPISAAELTIREQNAEREGRARARCLPVRDLQFVRAQRMNSISWYVGSGQPSSATMLSSESAAARIASIGGSALSFRCLHSSSTPLAVCARRPRVNRAACRSR